MKMLVASASSPTYVGRVLSVGAPLKPGPGAIRECLQAAPALAVALLRMDRRIVPGRITWQVRDTTEHDRLLAAAS